MHNSGLTKSTHKISLSRVEDAYLLRGEGAFLDDLPTPAGTLHAAVVRSPVAHGEIRAIRTARAQALEGVAAVLTIEDVEQWSDPFIVSVKTPMRQWPLARDRVRYVGEPVAVVVACSRAVAEDAADLVELEIAELPAVLNADAALGPQSPVIHEALGTNCIVDRVHEYGPVEQAFRTAEHCVEIETHYPRNSCTPIECGGLIATYRAYDDSYDVTSNFMGPYSLHVVMSSALRVPGNRLRHRYPRDSGGSFGVKQAMFPYVVLMCLAARKAGASVKFIEDRLEHLVAATSATARTTRLRAAVNSQGKILALDYDQIEDCGAYLRAPEPATLYRMHSCMTGAYDITALRVRNRVVLLNKTPTGLVRGFGGAQVYFALERLIQKIAGIVGMPVPEVMAANFIKAKQFPYRSVSGGLYDSGDYEGAWRALERSPEYQDILERQRRARSEGRLYGVGYAAIVEPSISNMGYIATVLSPEQRAKAGPKNGATATATVSVDPSGSLSVQIASTPAGQGHQTVAAQVVANVLGVRTDQIVVNTELDTLKDAWFASSGNYSSRFAGAVAGAVHLASLRIRQRIAAHAATLFACEPSDVRFQDGVVSSQQNPERQLPFSRIASAFHWAPDTVAANASQGIGLRETVYLPFDTLAATDPEDRVNASAAYGFVLDVCGVEIDKATCRPIIDRYVSVHDAGVILNPLLADGQVYGAFAQAVGASLFEEFAYDSAGNFLNGTFADYRIPTATEVPVPTIIHRTTPSPVTPLGAKGIAEGNSMSTPACVANAIADAIGVEDIRLPAFPSRVHELLISAGHLDPVAAAKSSPQPVESLGAGVVPESSSPLSTSGEVSVAAAPDDIFAVVMDAQRLKHVIPGCESIEKTSTNPDQVIYKCRSVIRIGVVKAGFDVVMQIYDIQAPTRFSLKGHGSSPLGNLVGSGVVSLVRVEDKTLLSYRYQVAVSGKLAAVGSRLLEGSSRLVLGQFFKALSRQAGGSQSGSSHSWWRRFLGWLGGRP
jgi:2-furoyl-CoA dehydrogenase large subunit